MAERAEYNFPDHTTGATFDGVEFTVVEDGSPLNLTGAKIEMYVGKSAANVRAAFTTENGSLTIPDPTAGKFQLPKQIITLQPGVYYHTIEITLQTGEVRPYIFGSWPITSKVVFNG